MAMTQTSALTTARVVRDAFMRVESPADKFIDRLREETDGENCLVLASRALRHDPGCIEALLYLADRAKSVDHAIGLLQTAVAAGEQLWAPIADEEGDEMTWWGFSATRPYMQAIKALGLAHCETGNFADARACWEKLIEMNPHDNQGVRFLLARLDEKSPPVCGLR